MLRSLSYDSSGVDGAAVFIVVLLLVELVLVGLAMWIYWRIVSKTGWPGWYVLGMLVPILNLVLLVMAAFKEWPIEAENRMLRQQLAYGGYGGYSGYSGVGGAGPTQGHPAVGYAAPAYPTTQPGYPPVAPPGYQPPPGTSPQD